MTMGAGMTDGAFVTETAECLKSGNEQKYPSFRRSPESRKEGHIPAQAGMTLWGGWCP